MKREKEIQGECNSCFMVNLVASFKDSAYLYMLLECIMGGELFTYLQVTSNFVSVLMDFVQACNLCLMYGKIRICR